MNLKKTIDRKSCFLLLILFLVAGFNSNAQIYYHNFGTTGITAHPYTVAPTTADTHFSNFSWTNSASAWTSTAGATGEAIRLTAATAATITLTFNIAANYQADITSFNFWTQRSALGPPNWTMTINGINVGNGTTPTTGTALGNTMVANPVLGLTGTVTVVISLSGNTGNGTFRLDDFTLNGSVTSNCSGAIVNSFTPLTGPQNTLVTITGSGFLLGSGTSAVKFNGINATSFTVISDTVIKAYVPAGNAAGNISVTANGCEGFSATAFTEIVSASVGTFSSDIYISELYDAQAGDGGVIEIYNGTASPVNLSGYTIRRYGDIGGTTFYTINLVGIIPPGGIFLVGIGTGTTPCSIVENQHYTTGFNSNDEFQLYNGSNLIDVVYAPVNVGYSVVLNPNGVAPNPVFVPTDWSTSTTESCANIGMYNPTVSTPPAVTSPTSTVTCENNTAVFSVALANPTGFTFQWKTLNTSGVWVNVSNGMPYSGASTNTLTINPTPAAFDDNQFYCTITSAAHTLVSHAAQLEVDAPNVPNFPSTITICNGDTIPVLNAVSPNSIAGTWNPATISNTTGGSYVFTPNPGQCAATQTVNVAVNNLIVPNFQTSLAICSGDTVPVLNTISPNGITGVWNPATISNTIGGSYVFTPAAGQCATNATLAVTVNNPIVPNFATSLVICSGDTVPVLNTISPNGITGVWNPATISNTIGGSYVFTPASGQCASNATLVVTVNNSTVPNFATSLVICSGDTVPVLNTVSPNGITGIWNPSTISNTIGGNYVFTPAAGQCASNATLVVTVNNSTVPNFATSLAICSGDTIPVLNTISPNGITGVWNPATISNIIGGSYVFTPTSGQCASNATLVVTVNNSTVPNFTTSIAICSGDTVPVLNTISPNGITGVWNPSTISNTIGGSYVFTPAAGQCASNATLVVTVNNSTVPNFATSLVICSGDTVPVLNTISPNGITGVWNPAIISNTIGGNYVFTPAVGQCATNATLVVTVNNPIVPNFATSLVICSGDTVPVLNTISPNGISGIWNPSTISNTVGGNYVFTPAVGQCATNATLVVTVNNPIVPNFATSLVICSGDTVPVLNTISPNGITGVWNPATISNTIGGSYVFTPASGQCASNATLVVTVNNSTVPNFTTSIAICSGDTVPVLNTISPNGITGIWNPSTISNTIGGSYVFTPAAGQCASSASLLVVVNELPKPVLKDQVVCIDSVTNQVVNPASLYCGIPNVGYTFSWTHDGNPLPTTTNTHLATEGGDYEVTVTNIATGCSASDHSVVNVVATAVANAIVTPDFADNPTITVVVSGGSGSYLFQMDDGLSQENNQFLNAENGEHDILVTDKNGCSQLVLHVSILNYPHFFTPNGDGYHDFWNIGGLSQQQQSKIYIFDRYGKLLKTLKPSDTSGWDGTFNGNPLPATDYWFNLLYSDRNGIQKEFKSHFSLKR